MLIAGAGMAAALPGVVAAYTDLPVIGVPLRSSSSVARRARRAARDRADAARRARRCVSVDDAKNAAILAARILAQLDSQAVG